MAMTIVEAAPGITGGVDTHLDSHVAAALDPLGRLIGSEPFAADAAGYKALLGWLEGFGEVTKVGMEGTGSYGVGLARFLRRRGIQVVEVNRPNRQARRNHGKSDPLDAIEAARAALSGRASGAGKTKDGPVEAIRVLVVAKRSARGARIKAITQMRHLGFTAPEQLHCRMKGLSVTALVAEGAKLRPCGCRIPHPERLSWTFVGVRITSKLSLRVPRTPSRASTGTLAEWSANLSADHQVSYMID
jgi:hypothetical protein